MYDRLTGVVATVGSGLGDLIFSGLLIDFNTSGDYDAEQVCSGNLYDFGENYESSENCEGGTNYI